MSEKNILGVYEVDLQTTVKVTIYDDPDLLNNFHSAIIPGASLEDIATHIAHNTRRLGLSLVEGVGEEGEAFETKEEGTDDEVRRIEP